MKQQLNFNFYSILKNEDANPYVGDELLVVADGLGGAGSTVHKIDKKKHKDFQKELKAAAFGDFDEEKCEGINGYIDELLAPMIDEKDDTSALWASRIVIARFVYALLQDERFKGGDLSNEKTREELTAFLKSGLYKVAKEFQLEKGRYENQLVLPTTLAAVKYKEGKKEVVAEVLWAGDSRCYALTGNGLIQLSKDDEDGSGAITNLFYVGDKKTELHYKKYTLGKPCVLFAVSDGIFDPYEPYDNFGVETTLLDMIRQAVSVEELKEKLASYYDSIHADDATMAFVAFGVKGYSQLQKELQARTKIALDMRKKFYDLKDLLPLLEMDEEDVQGYVKTRTADKFEPIVETLLSNVEEGKKDFTTPEFLVRAHLETTAKKKQFFESSKKEKTKKAIEKLRAYMKEKPEEIRQYVFAEEFSSTGATEVIKLVDEIKVLSKNIEFSKSELAKKQASLKEFCEDEGSYMSLVVEKIDSYRKELDLYIGQASAEAFKKGAELNHLCWAWGQVGLYLGYKKRIPSQNVGKEDAELIAQIAGYIDGVNEQRNRISKTRKYIKEKVEKCEKLVEKFFSLLALYDVKYDLLLRKECFFAFGFGEFELTKEQKEKEYADLFWETIRKEKGSIIEEIIKNLAENYDTASIIDRYYNGTRLSSFRAYYKLKAKPKTSIEQFKIEFSNFNLSYEPFFKEEN